jgi:hypothetical protein
MEPLLYLLRDVIQLRRGPQDAPHAPRLLIALCAASLLLQFAIAHVVGIGGATSGLGVLALAFDLGVLYLLLSLRDLTNRFVQAALTRLGCAILFTLLVLPILFLSAGHGQAEQVQAWFGLVLLPIVLWKLVVDAHILRHSLDLPFLAGLVIAVLWAIAEYVLAGALGGPQAGA